MLVPVLLAAFVACSSPPATPEPAPKPEGERRPPVKEKAKTGNLVPGKGKQPIRSKGKVAKAVPARGMPMPKPVGAAGPVKATLTLAPGTSSPTPAPPAGGAPPADGAPPVDGAPPAPVDGAPPAPVDGAPPADGAPVPAPSRPVTDASMTLTWGEGGTANVTLGQVEGTCTSIAPVPVGPAGKQHTPLWTVACDDAGAKTELYVLQVNNLLAVVRMEGEAGPGAYKVVRRVPLVAGATIERVDAP